MTHTDFAMPVRSMYIRLGAQGRVVIPAPLRRALDLSEGDELVARAEGQTLVLQPRAEELKRLQAELRAARGSDSLVEQLIAERRLEGRDDSRE